MSGARNATFYAAQDEAMTRWTRHASARLVPTRPAPANDLDAVRERCTTEVPAAEHERRLLERGFTFGPSMKALRKMWRGEREALGQVELPSSGDREGLRVPPAMLDASLQFFWAVLPDADAEETFLPLSFGRIQIDRPVGGVLHSHVKLTDVETDEDGRTRSFKGEVVLFDEDARPLGRIESIAFRRGDRDALLRLAQPPMTDWFYESAWEPGAPLSLPAPPERRVATLAEPPVLKHTIDSNHDAMAESFGLDAHAELVRGLGQASAAYIARAVGQLGFDLSVDATLELETFRETHGVLPKYRGELKRLLAILAEDGVLGGDRRVQLARGASARRSRRLRERRRGVA